jgi:hypothetical protein
MCASACLGNVLCGYNSCKPSSRFGEDLQKSCLYVCFWRSLGMTPLACSVNGSSVYVSDKLCLFVFPFEEFVDCSLRAVGCLDLGFSLPLTFNSLEPAMIGQ